MRAELTGGGADDAAAECRVEGAEAVELYCKRRATRRRGVGAAAAADGGAWEEDLGEQAGEFDGPAKLFFAGKLGEVRECSVDRGIFGAEHGEDGVAEAIAGEGFVGVRGVFAPGLVLRFEVEAEVGAAGLEEGAEDTAFFSYVESGGDSGYAFEPCAAEELHEHGFGLVVEGVGGEDEVGPVGLEEG